MFLFTRRFYHNFKTLENEFKGKPIKYMEIGVFLGSTSEWMLDNILTHPDARLIGIDPWEWFRPLRKRFPTEEVWKEKMLDRIDQLREKYKGKAEFIKGYSQNILREAEFLDKHEDNSFDLIYIDGHHSIQCAMRDYVLTWPLLKIGGVMIFDDYLQRRSDEVKRVVDVILHGLGALNRRQEPRSAKIELLFQNYQVGFRKLKE
jgi:predicted O-methyltransferase YrrM